MSSASPSTTSTGSVLVMSHSADTKPAGSEGVGCTAHLQPAVWIWFVGKYKYCEMRLEKDQNEKVHVVKDGCNHEFVLLYI